MEQGTADPEIGCEKDKQWRGRLRNERMKHFKGESGEEGTWNCREGRCMARTPQFCSAISCLLEVFIGPQVFLTLTCEWLGYACTLFPICRRHVVYCTYCGGVSVLTNLHHGKPARGGPWYKLTQIVYVHIMYLSYTCLYYVCTKHTKYKHGMYMVHTNMYVPCIYIVYTLS